MPAPSTPTAPFAPAPDDPLGRAEATGDLESIKLVADIRASRAQERKATADAANAEAQFPELVRKRKFYERLLSTAQGTAALALITLCFQILQFGYTASQNRSATEDAQWKDVIKNISFDQDARSVSSVTNLATFYRSKRYAGNAKALSAAILPSVRNHDAFDRAFVNLVNETQWGDEGNLYAVGRAITDAYYTDIDHARDKYGSKVGGMPQQKLSDFLSAQPDDADDAIAEARLREWEIDSYSHYILSFWDRRGAKPNVPLLSKWLHLPGSGPYSADLQKIIFRYDEGQLLDMRWMDFSNASLEGSFLHNVDFTNSDLSNANLSAADLTGAVVAGTKLSDIHLFKGSVWTGVEWWKAESLSSELCRHLSKAYPPEASAKEQAQKACPL